MAETAARTPWHLKAHWIEACNCPHGCNCQFGGVPNAGSCEGMFGCEVAGERSSVRVPGALDMRLTPLKNPVTGEDKEVHIVYPKGGFFWNDGTIATTAGMHGEHGDLRIDWPGRFASASEVNWRNH